MTAASLLLKEDDSTSLSALVEKALQKKPPYPEYDLVLESNRLDLLPKNKAKARYAKLPSTDEGFESDIDSISIVSSDDSFTNATENATKTSETDSANGSASSDSDADPPEGTRTFASFNESHNLVSCMCYTDVKSKDILIFVINKAAYVFKFDKIDDLEKFYRNFTTFKALNSHKLYPSAKKFNLLQKTDNNGVTHIQITREGGVQQKIDEGPSSIISINTPEDNLNKLINASVKQMKKLTTLNQERHWNTMGKKIDKSASVSDLLNLNEKEDNKKIWNSSENLLDPPKRPERKKRAKGKAPPPPTELKQDIMSGHYVRVNVDEQNTNRFIIKSQSKEPHPKKLQNFSLLSTKPSLNFLSKPQILKYIPKATATLTRNKPAFSSYEDSWKTNSMPRISRQPRSKSESRIVQPMAYRYIDATLNYPLTYTQIPSPRLESYRNNAQKYSPNFSNRLFGLSPKLKDFNQEADWKKTELRRLGSEGNLKSVIKKDDGKKKNNEKKVTFSAYTTVQVV